MEKAQVKTGRIIAMRVVYPLNETCTPSQAI